MMAWMVCANVSIGASHPVGALCTCRYLVGEKSGLRASSLGAAVVRETRAKAMMVFIMAAGQDGTDVRDGRGRTSSRGAAAGAQRLAGAGLAASRAVTASGPRGG